MWDTENKKVLDLWQYIFVFYVRLALNYLVMSLNI